MNERIYSLKQSVSKIPFSFFVPVFYLIFILSVLLYLILRPFFYAYGLLRCCEVWIDWKQRGQDVSSDRIGQCRFAAMVVEVETANRRACRISELEPPQGLGRLDPSCTTLQCFRAPWNSGAIHGSFLARSYRISQVPTAESIHLRRALEGTRGKAGAATFYSRPMLMPNSFARESSAVRTFFPLRGAVLHDELSTRAPAQVQRASSVR